MAGDDPIVGFDPQTAVRIMDATLFVESDPRYVLPKRKYGAPQPHDPVLFCVLEDFVEDEDCPDFMVGSCKFLSTAVPPQENCNCMSAGSTTPVYALKNLASAGGDLEAAVFAEPFKGDRVYAIRRGERWEVTKTIRRNDTCILPCLRLDFDSDPGGYAAHFSSWPLIVRQGTTGVGGTVSHWRLLGANVYFDSKSAFGCGPFAGYPLVDIHIFRSPIYTGDWFLVINIAGNVTGNSSYVSVVYTGSMPECCTSCSITWTLDSVTCNDSGVIIACSGLCSGAEDWPPTITTVSVDCDTATTTTQTTGTTQTTTTTTTTTGSSTTTGTTGTTTTASTSTAACTPNGCVWEWTGAAWINTSNATCIVPCTACLTQPAYSGSSPGELGYTTCEIAL